MSSVLASATTQSTSNNAAVAPTSSSFNHVSNHVPEAKCSRLQSESGPQHQKHSQQQLIIDSALQHEQQHEPKLEEQQQQQVSKAPHPLWPSLFAGAVQAVIFNPVDRALYLRVHLRAPSFFTWSLWNQPFQGFANAAIYRTISGATYLYFQDTFRWAFGTCGALALPTDNRYVIQACVGTAAGAANGWCLNGFQLVKYRIWSRGEGSFWEAAVGIYKVGGAKMFFRGAGISMMRDVCFGLAYEVLRTPGLSSTDGNVQFTCNVVAGAAACVFSSPFNYCRNLVFGSSTRSSPLHTRRLLQFLWMECEQAGKKCESDPWAKWRHLNARFNLGWGSVRVGVGIAIGQLAYKKLSCIMENRGREKRALG